jgi:hypothetical protein
LSIGEALIVSPICGMATRRGEAVSTAAFKPPQCARPPT